MRRLIVPLALIVAVMIGLSVIQNLQVDQIGKKALRDAYIAQQPVKLTFRVVDQFVKPAVNYRFKVTLRSVRWFYWLYPRWADKQTECSITTDDQGLGHLNWRIGKAWNMNFSENVVNCKNTEKYVFPYPRLRGHGWREAKTFADDPLASFPVPPLNGGRQEVVMQVLRHDWPARVVTYRPQVPGQGPIGMNSPGIEAQDEMVFTLDIRQDRFLDGLQGGDLVMTIRNAKTAGQEYWYHRRHSTLLWNDPPVWKIRLDGVGRTGILPTGHSPVCNPPVEGYYKSLLYRSRADQFTFSPALSSTVVPDEWASGTPVYHFWGAKMDETFFIRTGSPCHYCWLEISLEVNDKDRAVISASGFCNADGTPHL